MTKRVLAALALVSLASHIQAQTPAANAALDAETLQHFQALLKLDTSSPPGNEIRAVEYNAVALPTMGTGATDMSNIRAKGPQCYGIGPAIDTEDGPKGFGAHSDQERILESELLRFARFHYELVLELARAR